MKKFWKNKRVTKLVTTWMAIFAILLSTLAPSISSAMAMRNSDMPSWAEICSTSNLTKATSKISKKTLVVATTASSKSTNSDQHKAKHCPFCLPHAGHYALPPAIMPCCAIVAGHDAFPPLYYQAPSLLFSWVSANPRGPPVLS